MMTSHLVVKFLPSSSSCLVAFLYSVRSSVVNFVQATLAYRGQISVELLKAVGFLFGLGCSARFFKLIGNVDFVI